MPPNHEDPGGAARSRTKEHTPTEFTTAHLREHGTEADTAYEHARNQHFMPSSFPASVSTPRGITPNLNTQSTWGPSTSAESMNGSKKGTTGQGSGYYQHPFHSEMKDTTMKDSDGHLHDDKSSGRAKAGLYKAPSHFRAALFKAPRKGVHCSCDRCKRLKIRCDDTPGGCRPCRQEYVECKKTPRKITRKSKIDPVTSKQSRRVDIEFHADAKVPVSHVSPSRSRLLTVKKDVDSSDEHHDTIGTLPLQHTNAVGVAAAPMSISGNTSSSISHTPLQLVGGRATSTMTMNRSAPAVPSKATTTVTQAYRHVSHSKKINSGNDDQDTLGPNPFPRVGANEVDSSDIEAEELDSTTSPAGPNNTTSKEDSYGTLSSQPTEAKEARHEICRSETMNTLTASDGPTTSELRFDRRTNRKPAGEKEPKRFKCGFPGCNKVLYTSAGLANHIAVDHFHKRWPYRVEGCEEDFRSDLGRKRHEATHEKMRTASTQGRESS